MTHDTRGFRLTKVDVQDTPLPACDGQWDLAIGRGIERADQPIAIERDSRLGAVVWISTLESVTVTSPRFSRCSS